jgi:hypothetical protein
MTTVIRQWIGRLALFVTGLMCFMFFFNWEHAQYGPMALCVLAGVLNGYNYLSVRKRLTNSWEKQNE